MQWPDGECAYAVFVIEIKGGGLGIVEDVWIVRSHRADALGAEWDRETG